MTPQPPPASVSSPQPPAAARLASLDAYRGLTMLLLMFTAANGDWQRPLLEANPGADWLAAVLEQCEHAEWRGLTFWDMIQPSFMFMVGVGMAYSCASRLKRGDSWWALLGHAVYRAVALTLLGVFLRSLGSDSTQWTLEDVVSQIGLGYVPLFLLWSATSGVRLWAGGLLLLGVWALYALWPTPGSDFDPQANGAVAHLEGFFGHWNQNANPGHYLDQWLLNLFPRDKPFFYNSGGYNTLNFVPSLVTMLLGLLTGDVLRVSKPSTALVARLLAWGAVLTVAGLALDFAGVCPLVKKVWTPAFTLVSGGLCIGALAVLLQMVDVWRLRRLAMPAQIVGLNPLTAYCMTWMLPAWTLQQLHTHVGPDAFTAFGSAAPMAENFVVGLAFWGILYAMHRRGVYLRF